MKNFLQLSINDRLSIFEQVSSPLSLQALEKDWWVTQTLGLIFSMNCAPHLVFTAQPLASPINKHSIFEPSGRLIIIPLQVVSASQFA
jgi:hypothetical protein